VITSQEADTQRHSDVITIRWGR